MDCVRPDFSKLPTLVWANILQRLPIQDIGRCALVCKKLNGFCNADFLWKPLYHFHYPKSDSQATHGHLTHTGKSYRELFKNASFIFFNNLEKCSLGSEQIFSKILAHGFFATTTKKYLLFKHTQNQSDNEIRVVDPLLNVSYTITTTTPRPSIISLTADRILTHPKENLTPLTLWDLNEGKSITTLDYIPQRLTIRVSSLFYYLFFVDTKGHKVLCHLKTGQLDLFEDFKSTEIKKSKFVGNYLHFLTSSHQAMFRNLQTKKQTLISLDDDYIACEIATNRIVVVPHQNPGSIGQIYMWDMAGKRLSNLTTDGVIISKCRVDKERIFVVADKRMKIFDAESGQLLHTLVNKSNIAKFYLKGDLISTTSLSQTKTWSISTGESVSELNIFYSENIFCFDSHYVFYTPFTFFSRYDRIEIENIQTGKRVCSIVLHAHTTEVKILKIIKNYAIIAMIIEGPLHAHGVQIYRVNLSSGDIKRTSFSLQEYTSCVKVRFIQTAIMISYLINGTIGCAEIHNFIV